MSKVWDSPEMKPLKYCSRYMSKTFANHECLKHKKLASELLAPIHCLRSERKTNLTRYPYTARESTFDWQIKQTRNSLIRSTPNLTARILDKSARILNRTARSDVRALPRSPEMAKSRCVHDNKQSCNWALSRHRSRHDIKHGTKTKIRQDI